MRQESTEQRLRSLAKNAKDPQRYNEFLKWVYASLGGDTKLASLAMRLYATTPNPSDSSDSPLNVPEKMRQRVFVITKNQKTS